MATREARPTAAHLETLETARERIQRLADDCELVGRASTLRNVARALAGDWRPLEESLSPEPKATKCQHHEASCDECGDLVYP